MPDIGSAEVEVAILVHRACFENDDVHRVKEPAVVVRHLAEIERQIVATSGIVFPAVVTGKMPAEPEKVFAVRVVFHHRARPHRKAGADLYVLQFFFPGGKGFVEHVGLAQPHAVIEPHARLDEGGGVFSGNALRRSACDPPGHADYLSSEAEAAKRGYNCRKRNSSNLLTIGPLANQVRRSSRIPNPGNSSTSRPARLFARPDS